MYDNTATTLSSVSWSTYSSDSDSDSDEEFEDENELKTANDNDFLIGRTTHSISITDKELFEEHDEEYKYDQTWNPLEQGLLFKLLFRRFRENFISKFIGRVNTVENLIMTSIFSKLASVPLCDKNIETYYLHAMMYWELNNEPISLIQSLILISNQIKARSNFPEFEYLKKETIPFMINPEKDVVIKAKYNKKSEELTVMQNTNKGLIEGSIVFEEFLKEYLTIFDAKNELIKLMNMYEKTFEEDLILDEAIQKLNKVKKWVFVRK